MTFATMHSSGLVACDSTLLQKARSRILKAVSVSTLLTIALSANQVNDALGQDGDAHASEVHESIEAGNVAYIEAMANADARAFAALYDPEGARLSGGGEVVQGRKSIMDQIGGFFTRIGPVTATMETVDVWTIRDRAYETGRWTYTFTPPGDSRRTIGGHYVTIWKLQPDGSWKISVEMSVPGTEL